MASLIGRLRQECQNENWFMSLEDARYIIEAWRIHYNQRRPHYALGWMTRLPVVSNTGGRSDTEEYNSEDLSICTMKFSHPSTT